MKVDPQSVATGYRTSKVVGSTVVNEANETVGTIDDLIVTPSEKVPFAVLSVGGFLGMGKNCFSRLPPQVFCRVHYIIREAPKPLKALES
jgi:hypothetical protein